MSLGAGGPHNKRGQYTRRACNECRRRRCKCDGAHPACGSCLLYGHECSWDKDTAFRPPTKQLIETLRVKVRSLEDRIARMHSGEQLEGDRVIGSNATHSLPVPRGLGAPVPSVFRRTTLVTAPHVEKFPWLANLACQTEPPLSVGTDAANQPLNTIYQFAFNIDPSIPPDGQSLTVRQSLLCDWSRHLPPLNDIHFTRLEHDTLLDRYFRYSGCWLMSIVPQLFLHDMLHVLTHTKSPFEVDHYSPMLHCSLLASATALSDNPLIRQQSTRERFATKAKEFLHEDVGRPCLALVQALAVLLEYHCGLGEREQGYMYLGMSIRAARAIGLGRVQLRRPEAHLAAILDWHFWSIYSQDKIMALDMDVDYDLQAADFDSELPCVDWGIDPRPWFNTTGSTPAFELDQSNRSTRVFTESCKLMLIAESIIRLHYRNVAEISDVDNEALNIHSRLQAWLNDLPAGLLDSERSSIPFPHIITTNLFYWYLVLRLHQPFYRPTATRDNPLGTVSRPFGDLSDMLCDRAASKIVHLVELYSRWYGLRFYPRQMIQVIFAAGSLLLLKQQASVLESTLAQRADTRDAILKCIAALRGIGQTWRYAEMYANQLQTRLRDQDQGLANQSLATRDYSTLTSGELINSQAGQVLDAIMWDLDSSAANLLRSIHGQIG